MTTDRGFGWAATSDDCQAHDRPRQALSAPWLQPAEDRCSHGAFGAILGYRRAPGAERRACPMGLMRGNFGVSMLSVPCVTARSGCGIGHSWLSLLLALAMLLASPVRAVAADLLQEVPEPGSEPAAAAHHHAAAGGHHAHREQVPSSAAGSESCCPGDDCDGHCILCVHCHTAFVSGAWLSQRLPTTLQHTPTSSFADPYLPADPRPPRPLLG